MKQETNNEMDLLLRRFGRRDDVSVSSAAGDHLDADELSSYAENAVPAAARARYTAHLADCSRCRELVVQLSASAGVVHAVETATVAKPSVLSTILATLFTPMVLRYAAPALGLIVVAVIGFVVLRREGAPEHVTQVTNNEQRPSSAPETASPSFNDAAKESQTKPGTSAEGFVTRQKENQQTDPAPPNAAPVVTTVETEVSKDSSAAQPKLEQQAASANEPPAPKPSATPVETVSVTATDAKKKEIATTTETAVAPAPAAPSQDRAFIQRREDRKTGDVAGAANSKAEPADKVTAGAGAVASGRRERMSEKDESAETRSVAGRRFRKQGNVWIDTAYDASRDTTTLRRGSEQYRALIGDEPSIKTIADQLEGEIIVVWKGRAYRIR